MTLSTDVRDNEAKKFRDTSSGPAVAVVTESQTSTNLVDIASPTVIYLGEAVYNSLESDPVWKIQKVEIGSIIKILNASNSYNQIWNNRASLTYV